MDPNENRPRVKRVVTPLAQRTTLSALDSSADAKAKSVERPTVRINQCRTKLLDPDNLVASVKALLDGLSEAGLIAGDSSAQIRLDVTQTKVAHRTEHKTLIEIDYETADL